MSKRRIYRCKLSRFKRPKYCQNKNKASSDCLKRSTPHNKKCFNLIIKYIWVIYRIKDYLFLFTCFIIILQTWCIKMSEDHQITLLFNRLDKNRRKRITLQIIVWILVFFLSLTINSYYYLDPILVIVVWSIIGIVATVIINYHYRKEEIKILIQIKQIIKSNQ